MATLRFRIGTAFPAEDPVARFVSVLAMISNDWLRLFETMESAGDTSRDAPGVRVMSFRQQASLYHEAATFISQSARRFPEIGRFISGLSVEAQDAYERAVGGRDPRSAHYQGSWLTDHRNLTFHYPAMHPQKATHGQEEIMEALRAAADLESTITEDDTLRTIRCRFADEIVVQWLPDVEASSEVVAGLREAVTALGTFARHALAAYLAKLPQDAATIERDPPSDGTP